MPEVPIPVSNLPNLIVLRLVRLTLLFVQHQQVLHLSHIEQFDSRYVIQNFIR